MKLEGKETQCDLPALQEQPDVARLIVVEQLPVITQRLQTVADAIAARVELAAGMACTEDTLQETKRVRAELNREFQALEARRKAVKAAVMQPYITFEESYRTYVSGKYQEADTRLKQKIDCVSDGLLQRKKDAVEAFFTEYCASVGLDWLRLDDSGIKINRSITEKKCKEQAAAFADRVLEDMEMLADQDGADEMTAEYKRTLNATQAIRTVKERREAVKREAEERAHREQRTAQDAEAVASVETALPCAQACDVTIQRPTDPVLRLTFTVTAPKSKLKTLKRFLEDGGYDYE